MKISRLKALLLVVIIGQFIVSCVLFSKGEYDLKSLQKDIEVFIKNDGSVSEVELTQIIEKVKSSSNRKMTSNFIDSSGDLNVNKLTEHIVSIGKRIKRDFSSDDIWSSSDDAKEDKSFNINVYLENSGSMDGYVKGVTEFEQALYSYFSNIKIAKLTDSLNLFYINNTIIKQGNSLEDYIANLEPSTFKLRGGNRRSSDIANVLDLISLLNGESFK